MLFAMSDANEAALIGSITPSVLAICAIVGAILTYLKARDAALAAKQAELHAVAASETNAKGIEALQTAAANNAKGIESLHTTAIDSTAAITKLSDTSATTAGHTTDNTKGIEAVHKMVDGQRTDMLADLKTATNEITELKRLMAQATSLEVIKTAIKEALGHPARQSAEPLSATNDGPVTTESQPIEQRVVKQPRKEPK